jgi:ABC-type microcin C transport system permease subunit YejB
LETESPHSRLAGITPEHFTQPLKKNSEEKVHRMMILNNTVYVAFQEESWRGMADITFFTLNAYVEMTRRYQVTLRAQPRAIDTVLWKHGDKDRGFNKRGPPRRLM